MRGRARACRDARGAQPGERQVALAAYYPTGATQGKPNHTSAQGARDGGRRGVGARDRALRKAGAQPPANAACETVRRLVDQVGRGEP